jgi:hypothetical protein
MSQLDDYGMERPRPRKTVGAKGRGGKKRGKGVVWWRAIVLAFVGLWMIGGAFKYGAIIYRQGWKGAFFGTNANSPKGSALNEPDWQEFVHHAGGFRINVPGPMRHLTQLEEPGYEVFGVELPHYACVVHYMTLPPSATAGKTAEQIRSTGLRTMHPQSTFTGEKAVDRSGRIGIETRCVVADRQAVIWAFYESGVVVFFEFFYEGTDPVADRERFFNSLEFNGSPSAPRAGFPVAGTTPAGFPESPAKNGAAGASTAGKKEQPRELAAAGSSAGAFDVPPAGGRSGASSTAGDAESPFKAKDKRETGSAESPFQPKSKTAGDEGASPFKVKEESPFKVKDEPKTADASSPFQPKGKSAAAGASAAAAAKKSAPTREKQTAILGGSGGKEFRTVGSGGRVIGFQFDTGQWLGEEVLRRFEPVSDGGGKPFGLMKVETARDGYAVGAVEVDASKLVNAVRLVYMRVGDDGLLDPNDSYQSDWLGKPTGRKPRLLTGNGKPVIGIHGRRLAMLDAVGLVFE